MRIFSGWYHNLFLRSLCKVSYTRYGRRQCKQIHTPTPWRYRFHKLLSWRCSKTFSITQNIYMMPSIHNPNCVPHLVHLIHHWMQFPINKEEKIKCCQIILISEVNYGNTGALVNREPSWSWLYGSWIYNYLCNQCLSQLNLWGLNPLMARYAQYNIMWKVCQWLATGRWFSLGIPVSSTKKADRHDITEILLKVALNTIYQTKAKPLVNNCKMY